MIVTIQSTVTLEEFLKLPETKPATEYINGETQQKPMPQGEHSLLQSELCERINQVSKSKKIAYAFPELRCTFGGRSIVPDVAVFRWSRIKVTEKGRIANKFNIHPDWCIEILSPEQSQTQVLEKLLFCSQHGTELGWLIILEEDCILSVNNNQQVQLLRNNAILPVLKDLDLSLKVEDIFSWLNWNI